MKSKRKPHGRHPFQRLTPVTLRTKMAPGRYADGNGLYLVVDPSGAKRWIWRGVIQGKRSDLGLGGVSKFSLHDAREEAIRCWKLARKGGNPRLDRRQAQRVVPTFKQAAISVHTLRGESFKNAKHRTQWLTSLENDVFPSLGSRPVNTIESGDVLAVLTPIWTTKPETARRLKQRIKTIFDWAKASQFYEGDNPTEGLKKVLPNLKSSQVHHAALPYSKVPTFVADLQGHTDTSELTRLALELLILTATRTNEVLYATLCEFNLDEQLWTIPGARMKSGKEHRIPLCFRALEILERVQVLHASESPWMFPGTKPGKPLSNMTLLKAARRITTATLTTHGFRSSFRDWCEEKTNTPHTVCEAALAHTVRDKTEAAYRRTDLFERRRALMDLWAHFITSTPGKVLVHTA